jgi:hypothetical protein
MKSFRLIIFFLALAFDVSAQLLKSAGWEASESLGSIGYVEGCCSYSVTKSDSVKHSGSYSGRYELRSTDPVTNSKRAEQTVWNNSSNPNTSTRWYDVYMMIPNDPAWLNDPKAESIWQFHDKSSGCSASPPLNIEIRNSTYYIDTRYSTADYCVTGNRIERTPVAIGSINGDKGKWVRWTINYYPIANNTGYIYVYKDGVEVFKLVNAYTNYVGSQFPYFKIGVYKWTWTSSGSTSTRRTLYVDDLKIYGSSTTKDDIFPPTTNIKPVVNAGPDKNLTYGTTSTVPNGSATDADGIISSLKWEQIGGPNTVTFSSTSTTSPTVGNLITGTYQLRFRATDNAGDSAVDYMTITVAAAAPNLPPTVDATSTQNFYSRTDQITLSAVIGDPDGPTPTLVWTQLTGPVSTITAPTAATTTVTGIVDGDYVFLITVTDSSGDSISQEVSVKVSTWRIITITPGVKVIFRPSTSL